MKNFFHKYYVLFIITLISAAGLCALSFLTILDYSFDNEEQLIATCNEGLIEEIETSIRSGKTLSNYYGISDVLKRAGDLLSKGSILVIENDNNRPVASNTDLQSFSIDSEKYGVVEQEILDKGENTIGTLFTYYDKDLVRQSISHVFIVSVIGSLIIFLLIIIACYFFYLKNTDSDTGLIIRVIMVGIIIQGIFLTVNYSPEFEKAAERSVENVASYINSSLTSILDKGVSIDEISDLEDYLKTKQEENSSIKSISLSNTIPSESADKVIVSELEMTGSNLLLVYNISQSYVRRNVLSMVLMFVATIVLAVIVMKESLSLSEIIEFRKSKSFNKPEKEQFDDVAKVIRYGNFLSVTFDYMCLSFSALQIKEWNRGIFSMSPQASAALSISICSMADLIGMMAMPSIGKKLKGKHIMTVSAVILVISNALCFMTTSPLIIVIMRFFSGLATAGIKQSRNYVISQGYSSESERNANLNASNTGVIGGILCGMGLGGVVAGVFGYQTTFLVSCIGYILYLIFEFFCVPWKLLSENNPDSIIERESGNLIKRVINIFSSMSVWKAILLMIVPQYFLLMVIVCLIPGRIQSLSLPGVVLTYANLLNGITGLYIGELAYKKLITKLKSDVKAESLVLITGAVSMIILDIPFIPSAIMLISAILSGLVDGMGTPISTDIFMGNMVIMENLSDTETLMIYSVIGSAVMSVAPFILEFCEKSRIGMLICSILIAAAAIMLVKIRRPGRKPVKK
ncbi:MAG: MFS transporter [Lachnospiraceae bacterium]|nr:MFS transporter [Lachnospiraceae bacterium]